MSIFDKVKSSAAKAAEKAQQAMEITRLNSQINSRKKQIEECYTKIGESVFHSHQAADLSLSDADIARLSAQIVEHQNEIAALNAKIQEVKQEKACACGNVVHADVMFCPSCGHKF